MSVPFSIVVTHYVTGEGRLCVRVHMGDVKFILGYIEKPLTTKQLKAVADEFNKEWEEFKKVVSIKCQNQFCKD